MACSQRVTTEEEFAQSERERPLVSAPTTGSVPPVGVSTETSGASAGPVSAPSDPAQTIRGTIEAPTGAAGGILFLFVRPAGATGGPPLAVQRIPSPAFPLAFSIGPGDAMVASGPFPERVTIEARLDGDGNAMTEEPGDLSARSETAPGASDVVLALAEGA
jgi:cytochrome c-type biogenesis protein CcmH